MTMKNFIFACSMLLVLASCSKKNDDDSSPAQRSASYKVNGSNFTVTKPYLGIFNNNGTIYNTLTLTATDGSEVELKFTGNTPSTYTLQSFSDALFTTAAGKQYNATSGSMTTSSYVIDNAVYKSTGTFHFKAKAIIAPLDSVEITDGIFTNASNEF